MLSREDTSFDGLEFEETFPTETAPEPETPAPAAPPRLTVVRDEAVVATPEPAPQPSPSSDRFDELVKRIDSAITAALDQRIEQRLATFRAEIDRAFASRTEQPAAASPERMREQLDLVRDAIRAAESVRDVARVLRDAVNGLEQTAVFALAMHHPQHDEVVYRYRVATSEELGAAVRDGIDDGPGGAAAHADGWLRAQKTVRAGARNVTVHTAQSAIRTGEHIVGVVTLQTERAAFSEPVLVRVAAMIANAAPRLVELRDANALRGA